MNISKNILTVLCAALLAVGCAMPQPQSQKLNFVPVDSSKYPNPETLQNALVEADRVCKSSGGGKKNEESMNAMKAARESMENAGGASYVICMGDLGFMQQQ